MRQTLVALVGALTMLALATTIGRANGLLEAQGHMFRWGQPAGSPDSEAETHTITYFALTDSFEPPAGAIRLSSSNCGRMKAFSEIVRSSPHLTGNTATAELEAAFKAWEAVANISFRPAADADHANIVIGASAESTGKAFANIAYDRQFPIGPVEKALGRPDIEINTPVLAQENLPTLVPIRQAYVCFNASTAWKIGFDGNLEIYDLKFTFMHEIGHAIGLDHPGRTGAVMAYRYDESVRDPAGADISAVQSLYGRPVKEQTGGTGR